MPRRKRQDTDESEELSQDSDAEKQKKELNRPKVDRILKDNINLKKIIINVSMTQYPVVSEVAEELNWKIQTDPQAGDWDIFWTDYSIEPDILIRMHFHQKINHYPGIYIIARKNLLGLNLMSMRNQFPQQYNFFPLTWMLPSQYSEFRMYYESVTKGKVRTYIVKPEAQCQGRGIFLTRSIEDLENGSHYVIQRYVTKPYLIDGLKFDLRIYVLLCGTDPMRVYLFEEGLARFATEPYVEPCSANLDQMYVHLTNYAINKLNPKFVFNKSVNDMSTGHKRSLTSVYKLLQKKGENVPLLKQKIKDVINKTLITSMPLMSHQYRYSQPQEYSGNMCFHILGIDILITEAFEPLLLEVNHTPSFTTDTPLDTYIKHKLIKDTLILMNINTKTKTALYNQAKEYNKERLHTGKRQIFHGEMKDREIEKAQKIRDEFQSKHLGGFEKIHPVDDPELEKKYKTLLAHATKTYAEENTLRARMEEKEAKKMFKEERQLFRENKAKKGGLQPATTTDLGTKHRTPTDSKITSVRNLQNRSTTESKTSGNTHQRVPSSQAGNSDQLTKGSVRSTTVKSTTSSINPSLRLMKKDSRQNREATEELLKSSGMMPGPINIAATNVIYNNSMVSSSSATIPDPLTSPGKDHTSNKITTGLNPASSKYMGVNGQSSRTKIRKASSHIVQLPYLPCDDNTGLSNRALQGMLLSESQLIEERSNQRTGKSTNHGHQKASSYNFKKMAADIARSTDHKSRTAKLKKPTTTIVGDPRSGLGDDIKPFSRGGLKTGNFLMPKIFDLNVYIREQERQHQTLKPPGLLMRAAYLGGGGSTDQ